MTVLDDIAPRLTASYRPSTDVEGEVLRLRGQAPAVRPPREGWVAVVTGEQSFVVGKFGSLCATLDRVCEVAAANGVPEDRIRNVVEGSAAEFRAALRERVPF